MTMAANGPGVVTLGADDRVRAVAAVKAALELALDDHDDLLAALAETALGLAEQFLGQMLIARTVTVTLPVRSGWQRLVPTPVTAITNLAGVTADGSAVSLPVDGYEIDILRGEGWVRLHDVAVAVRVTAQVTAGAAADWDAVPPAIRQGAVLLAAYLFSERDTTSAFTRDVAALRGQLDGPLQGAADAAGRGIENALVRAARSGRLGFEDLRKVALSVLAEIAASAIRSGIDAILGGGRSGGGGGGGGLLGAIGSLFGAPGRATGGPVAPGRAYVVGERGPELFVPTSSGRIETRGSGGTRDVRISINIAAPTGTEPQALARSSRQIARAVRASLTEAE